MFRIRIYGENTLRYIGRSRGYSNIGSAQKCAERILGPCYWSTPLEGVAGENSTEIEIIPQDDKDIAIYREALKNGVDRTKRKLRR